ncbi:MAG TPA: ABC transporter substrate-binding protein [Acidobacteriota bacterium]|nr:ABC transporter substrate-binding protein [Acidobacteriota bacterium]
MDDHQRRAAEGEVIVGVDEAAESLDPRIGTSLASYRVHQLIYNPLTDQDIDGRIVPSLAESWESEEIPGDSGSRWIWRFKLRSGVLFHDERPLTADDVVYTYSSLLSPEFVSRKKAAFDFVESVAAESPLSVVFTLDKPQPWFPAALAAVGIVPEGFGKNDQPVGTGPFRYKGREGSQRFFFAGNENFFLGAPGIEKLTLKVVPDPTTMALELMHGSIDLIVNDISPNAVPLMRSRGFNVVTAPGLPYEYIGINHRHPVLGDRLVRQAIAHAIDREAIISTYLDSLARPAVCPLLPRLWEGKPEFAYYEYEPEKAKKLLDAAGYPDPDGGGPEMRFSIIYKCSTNRGGRDLATIFKQQLSEIGIDLDVRSLEFQTFYADIVAGNFALYQLRWVGIANPDFFGAAFHSTSVPDVPGQMAPAQSQRRGSFNRGRYNNPEVDLLIEQAEAEQDMEHRWRILARLQKTLAEDLPYIDLWYRDNFVVGRPDLEGFELTLNASFSALRKLRYR